MGHSEESFISLPNLFFSFFQAYDPLTYSFINHSLFFSQTLTPNQPQHFFIATPPAVGTYTPK